MTKKRRRKQATRKFPNSQTVQVVTYEITDAPILDREYRRLPKEVKEAINRLHDLSQRRPSEAIPELLDWIAHYPDVPVFYNYLSAAYSFSGRRDKAEAAIEDNYQRNPDYLFARIHYGELCLTRRDYDRIAEVFDHKFDLKLLYPKRNKFHVSEVMGFMGLLGVYFFETGRCETAEKHYDMMNQIDSTHPFTKRLRRKLLPGLIRWLFRLVRKHWFHTWMRALGAERSVEQRIILPIMSRETSMFVHFGLMSNRLLSHSPICRLCPVL